MAGKAWILDVLQSGRRSVLVASRGSRGCSEPPRHLQISSSGQQDPFSPPTPPHGRVLLGTHLLLLQHARA